MTQQELFEKIADLEEMTFYNMTKNGHTLEQQQMNKLAREILIAYAEMTGCHN